MRLALVALLAAAPLAAQNAPAPTPTPTSLQSETGPIRVERLAALDSPWGMAWLPDGRLLVTEKSGRLRAFAKGQLSAPISGVPAVTSRGQGGLLDVAVDPAFATNQIVYLYFTEAADPQPAGLRETGDARFGNGLDTADVTLKGGAIARGRLVGNALQDVRVIWRQVPKTIGRGHYGGRMLLARDGKLYVTSGERMRFDPAQDSASNLGKVVRIDPDGSLPADNPFGGIPGRRGDVWTMGHRNPLGIAEEPETGRIFIHEMGPQGGDEINLIEKGKNYGWPRVSNGDNYDGSHIPDHATSRAYQRPVHSWTPVVSPSGLIFYTGGAFPAWRGSMLFGGLSSMSLLRVRLRDGRPATEERIYVGKRVRDVIQASDGALLIITDGPNGELLRLTPRAGP